MDEDYMNGENPRVDSYMSGEIRRQVEANLG